MTKKLLFILALTLNIGIFTPKANAAAMMELIEVEQQPQISVVNGNVLRIEGANGKILEIYNVAGVRIKTVRIEGAECLQELNQTKGCYIVKIGKTVRKISIK